MLFTARHGGSFVKFVNVYHFLVQKPGMRGIVNGSVFVMVCGFCEFVTVYLYIIITITHILYTHLPPTRVIFRSRFPGLSAPEMFPSLSCVLYVQIHWHSL